jgi:hypothetical protein
VIIKAQREQLRDSGGLSHLSQDRQTPAEPAAVFGEAFQFVGGTERWYHEKFFRDC